MYSFNFLEFLFKNLFWYSIGTLIFGSLNPTEWELFVGFVNNFIFVLFEIMLFGSCLKEINE